MVLHFLVSRVTAGLVTSVKQSVSVDIFYRAAAAACRRVVGTETVAYPSPRVSTGWYWNKQWS